MNRKHEHNSIGLVFICTAAILLSTSWLAACGEDAATPQSNGGGDSPRASGAEELPPAPDRLSVTVGEGEVSLRWRAVHGATGYTVYRSTLPGVKPGQADPVPVRDVQYTDTDVQPEVTFHYIVTASNGRGEGPPSPEVAGKARSAVPGTPFQVTVLNGDGQVTLSWPDASGAEGYALYFSTTPGVSKATASRIAPVSSPYTHAQLSNGMTYYYALAGINPGGQESPLSGEVAARPVPPSLVPPTGVSAAAGEGRVTLTWNPVIGAESYALYWSLSPGVTPGNGVRIDMGTSPFEHTGLVNGITYHYILTALNGFEESEPSIEVSAMPGAGPLLPDLVVSALEVLSFTESSIAYRYTVKNIGEASAWLDGPTDAEYDNVSVHAFVSSDEIFANAGDVPAGGTILGLSPLGWLNPGESFTGQFSSSTTIDLLTHPFLTLKVDWGRVLEESNEDNNTLAVRIQPQVPIPEPPASVSAEAGDGMVTVQWNAVAGASGYNLYWGTAPGVTKATGYLVSDVRTPFTHTGLANGTTYHYVVTTLSAGGESAESVEVAATPGSSPCCGDWTIESPMNTARYLLASSVVGGKIYAMGGRTVHYTPDPNWSTVEEYDPTSGTWSFKSPIPTGRWGATSSAVNGTLYLIGGFNGSYLDTVEAYDPATDTWSARTPMPTPREGAASVAVNGKIYVIGGINDAGHLRTVEIYDPGSDEWTTGTPVSTARYEAAASVVNGIIYVIGGRGYLNTVEAFDPMENTWTPRAPIPTGRTGLVSGVLNGAIYVMGGYYVGSKGTQMPRIVDVYDPVTDTWSDAAQFQTGRYRPAASVVGHTIYLIGGYDGTFYADVEAYSLPPF